MRTAIELAMHSVQEGGGPFAAVVVMDGRVVGRGSNRVALDCDPTAHAEIEAIRDACRNLGRFELHGATLYVNCEPCPMCQAAANWAHVARICYGAGAADAEAVGFDDLRIRTELALAPRWRQVPGQQLLRDEALAVFRRWREKADRVEY